MNTGHETNNPPRAPATEDRGSPRHDRPVVLRGATVGGLFFCPPAAAETGARIEPEALERFENEGGSINPAIPRRTAAPDV
jgi:hypothetical protein